MPYDSEVATTRVIMQILPKDIRSVSLGHQSINLVLAELIDFIRRDFAAEAELVLFIETAQFCSYHIIVDGFVRLIGTSRKFNQTEIAADDSSHRLLVQRSCQHRPHDSGRFSI
jgi:hypothetical protein